MIDYIQFDHLTFHPIKGQVQANVFAAYKDGNDVQFTITGASFRGSNGFRYVYAEAHNKAGIVIANTLVEDKNCATILYPQMRQILSQHKEDILKAAGFEGNTVGKKEADQLTAEYEILLQKVSNLLVKKVETSEDMSAFVNGKAVKINIDQFVELIIDQGNPTLVSEDGIFYSIHNFQIEELINIIGQ
jgi:hypothetical protein